MDEKLYDLCDWAGIEAIVYSDHTNPHSILGPHITEDGILINMFQPEAKNVVIKLRNNKKYEMELIDEDGFFAILIPGKTIPKYTYFVSYDDGREEEIVDMYSYNNIISDAQIKKLTSGICYNAYDYLGSHVMTIDGVEGTLFAVWAPNALCVNVVGGFNNWEGRLYPMSARQDTGIFELFIPGVKTGELYKYEMYLKGGVKVLKCDPYARKAEIMPNDASIVYEDNDFTWNDEKWITARKSADINSMPMNIYQLHLGTWKVKDDGSSYSYRELASMLVDYVMKMGYTHVQLMPITEYREEESLGYKVTGYYTPTARYGTPEDFKYFINFLHEHNIGVIIDWVATYFAPDINALADFDGTHLYDHMDSYRGEHPTLKTRIFNYGRPEVSNFLIANAFFWIDKYHVDGLRINDVASMIRLDYGREEGKWNPNIYGENENLEAVEFLKHLNSIHAKHKDGSIIIAEDASSWQKITEKVEEEGLGFNYKWNSAWAADMMEYMKCDPLFRKGRHNQITLSMLYNYSEKFILELSYDVIASLKGSIISRLPGEYGQKLSNLKAIYGYMMAHPGKKLMFMGQDWAQPDEWNINNPLNWQLTNYENHAEISNYVKALNKLYLSNPALYSKDYSSEGFEWINDMDSDRSILSFIRKTDNKADMLLVICNFTPVTYEGYSVGVPYKGRYKEIFNSDSTDFGGQGNVNPRLKNARPAEYDGREFYINVTVPPMGVSIYSFTPLVPREDEEIKETDKKSTTKKAAVKKDSDKKTTAKKVTESTKKAASTVKQKAVETVNKAAETVSKVAKKAEATKVETKKVEAKKAEPAKVEIKKAEAKKAEPTKVETKKVEAKKAEPAKVETKKVEAKKAEPAKVETKKVEAKKAEPTKVETKKVEAKKAEPAKVETKKAEAKKAKEEKKLDNNK